jgi:hypothetical protein
VTLSLEPLAKNLEPDRVSFFDCRIPGAQDQVRRRCLDEDIARIRAIR